MVDTETIKRKLVLEMVTLAIVDFKNGNKRALIILERTLPDVVGLEKSRRIMEVIRKNITEGTVDIIDEVDKELKRCES